MFKTQVNVAVKVKTEGHPRFGRAGITTTFQKDGEDSVLVKLDASATEEAVEEPVSIADLQVL